MTIMSAAAPLSCVRTARNRISSCDGFASVADGSDSSRVARSNAKGGRETEMALILVADDEGEIQVWSPTY